MIKIVAALAFSEGGAIMAFETLAAEVRRG